VLIFSGKYWDLKADRREAVILAREISVYTLHIPVILAREYFVVMTTIYLPENIRRITHNFSPELLTPSKYYADPDGSASGVKVNLYCNYGQITSIMLNRN